MPKYSENTGLTNGFTTHGNVILADGSKAIGSGPDYAIAKEYDLTEFINILKNWSGCIGSVLITSAPPPIPPSWYSFIWIPHRSGGNLGQPIPGSDNSNWGTLLLFGFGGAHIAYRVAYLNSNISISTFNMS